MAYKAYTPASTQFFILWDFGDLGPGNGGESNTTIEEARDSLLDVVDPDAACKFRVTRVDYCVSTGALEALSDVTEEVMGMIADVLLERGYDVPEMNGVDFQSSRFAAE